MYMKKKYKNYLTILVVIVALLGGYVFVSGGPEAAIDNIKSGKILNFIKSDENKTEETTVISETTETSETKDKKLSVDEKIKELKDKNSDGYLAFGDETVLTRIDIVLYENSEETVHYYYYNPKQPYYFWTKLLGLLHKESFNDAKRIIEKLGYIKLRDFEESLEYRTGAADLFEIVRIFK